MANKHTPFAYEPRKPKQDGKPANLPILSGLLNKFMGGK